MAIAKKREPAAVRNNQIVLKRTKRATHWTDPSGITNQEIKQGLLTTLMEKIKGTLQYSDQEFAKALDISLSSLQRARRKKRLSSSMSQRLYTILNILHDVYNTFTNEIDGEEWLCDYCYYLREKPSILMQQEPGITQVRQEIMRIRMGAIA